MLKAYNSNNNNNESSLAATVMNNNYTTNDNEIPKSSSSSSSTTTPAMSEANTIEEEEVEITFLEDFLAGGLAGSASVIVGHPFDTVKVRMQTSPTTSTTTASGGGGLQSFGGISSLFRGMVAPLSMAAVINAIIFSSYASSSRVYDDLFLPSNEKSRDGDDDDKKKKKKKEDHVHGIISSEGGILIEHDDHHHHPRSSYQIGKNFVCGSIAGAIQTLVICPTEHVKCRLQTQQSFKGAATTTTTEGMLYKGPWDATQKIVSNHGIKGLYRGFWCTCLREIPAFGAYFSTYDLVKDKISEYYASDQDTQHAWVASAIAGGVSGSFTWGMIYPVDVIKSRIQTSSFEGKRESMMTVGRNLVRDYGWRYMYRGFGVTLARAFPVNGIIFPVYEFVLMELRQGGI